MLHRAVSSVLSVAVLTAGLSSAFGQGSKLPPVKRSATAPKAAAPKEKEAEAADPYAVPDGSPEEILQFVEDLQGLRPRFKNREELIQHVIKSQQSLVVAADKLLAHKDIDDETAVQAAEFKLQALFLLTRGGLDGAQAAALKAAKELSKDPRKAVAAKAAEVLRVIKISSVATLSDQERSELIAEVLESVTAGKFNRESISAAFMLGQSLEKSDMTAAACEYYEQLSGLLAKSDNEQWQEQAKKLDGVVRRLQLPGNVIEIKGTTLSGKPLDWESYRGKVVLVDFWATWCGPCIAELPNVKKQYRRYHGKGFDVLGISLDTDRGKLDAFVEKNEIPWTSLFESTEEDQGWNNPLAVHYGIMGIPTAILVDKDGKVVSMMARGPELVEQLEKLLGPAPEVEDDEPAVKKKPAASEK
jgi:thiol-disulfide isomerase/thioredoxin